MQFNRACHTYRSAVKKGEHVYLCSFAAVCECKTLQSNNTLLGKASSSYCRPTPADALFSKSEGKIYNKIHLTKLDWLWPWLASTNASSPGSFICFLLLGVLHICLQTIVLFQNPLSS